MKSTRLPRPFIILGFPGGVGAQSHLRQVLSRLDTYQVERLGVAVSLAHEKFDEDGRLKDEEIRELIRQLLNNLVELARKLREKKW